MARNGTPGHTRTMQARIRTLLVDDNQDFLNSAAAFLSRFSHLEVAGTARSALEGMERAAGTGVDLVLMDISMPGTNGFDAIRLLRLRGCRARIIILTLFDEDSYHARACEVGADGFVTKSEFATALLPAIAGLFDVTPSSAPAT